MPVITSEMILTAGPSITRREAEYTLDAVLNGWNRHMSDYTDAFEKTFAGYIGVNHAFTTSSCTGALHLALLGMGIGPGDEVIVPETTWIATAAVVTYVGAKPVFCDIDPETWVMDPKSVEKLITKKTKVIIPVHLYGNPVDMDPIIEMAEKNNIYILEDAAPSIGTIYKGRKTGSMGDAGAFSFQGAKALVTGEGGMYVTNNRELFDKTAFIWNQCREASRERAMCTVGIGWKYKMSNLQAALGLAQTERAEEIVEKKTQLFKWYYERLSDIECIKMNVQRPDTRNIYWMSSLVLDKKAGITREEFRQKLYERNIDTRTFFYPMSSFPMFESAEKDNPVAWDVPLRGVNLPSGHERTEEEIDYICAHIRDILGAGKSKKVSDTQPRGWLAYRDFISGKLKEYKNAAPSEIENYCIPVMSDGRQVGRLRPLTVSEIESKEDIELLGKWREKTMEWSIEQFKVTFEGTKKWLDKRVINDSDRLLFYVEDQNKKRIGHVGIDKFDFKKKHCELDAVLRGEDSVFKGGLTLACETVVDWAFEKLEIETMYLSVASDNTAAIKIYEKIGFKEIQRVPVMKVREGENTKWVKIIEEPYVEVEKYFVTMRLKKEERKG